MNNLQIFNSSEFGEIRGIEIDNEPWLVGKDVAETLGYNNPSKALADHVDVEDKLNNETLSSLGQRGGWLTNESGFYSLVFSSKMPKAKEFKHWVTSEVLPSIRKHGAYATPTTIENIIADPNNAIKLLQALNDEREKSQSLETELIKSNRVIETMKPKVSYYDKILKNPSLMNTTVIAQDYGMSARGFNTP